MGKTRTPIGSFIHSTWTNINIRCGKYRHLQTSDKCKSYKNVNILFTQKEFKNWCIDQKEYILGLQRPSIDRIDSNGDYSLDNIQVIELIDNVRKKRLGNTYVNGPKSNTKRGIRKAGNKFSARITHNKIETYLGVFETQEEAETVFKDAYYKIHNKYPY